MYGWRKEGISFREIGRRLKRDHTSLVDEFRRNRVGPVRKRREYFNQEYIPGLAHEKATKKALKQRQKAPLKEPAIFLYVREHLREPFFWTPEEISGRIKSDIGKSICTESIYQYIYSRSARRSKLWQYLTVGRKKRMKKNGRSVHRDSKIPGSISIDLRPEIVALRIRAGDWETDNIIGKITDQTALSVTVERLSRYTILTKLTDRLAVTKKDALVRRLGIYSQNLRLTLTADNGSENSQHLKIQENLKLIMYFCHAYHSWEKGSVENMNKRIRRFIPKGVSIDSLPDKLIRQVEWILNNTPRKCLGYLTPQEKMVQLQSSTS